MRWHIRHGFCPDFMASLLNVYKSHPYNWKLIWQTRLFVINTYNIIVNVDTTVTNSSHFSRSNNLWTTSTQLESKQNFRCNQWRKFNNKSYIFESVWNSGQKKTNKIYQWKLNQNCKWKHKWQNRLSWLRLGYRWLGASRYLPISYGCSNTANKQLDMHNYELSHVNNI